MLIPLINKEELFSINKTVIYINPPIIIPRIPPATKLFIVIFNSPILSTSLFENPSLLI